jgi:hypothetical protein
MPTDHNPAEGDFSTEPRLYKTWFSQARGAWQGKVQNRPLPGRPTTIGNGDYLGILSLQTGSSFVVQFGVTQHIIDSNIETQCAFICDASIPPNYGHVGWYQDLHSEYSSKTAGVERFARLPVLNLTHSQVLMDKSITFASGQQLADAPSGAWDTDENHPLPVATGDNIRICYVLSMKFSAGTSTSCETSCNCAMSFFR